MKSNNILEDARLALNKGDIANARQFIYRIKNYRNNPETLYLLALCHAMNNEYSEAEKLFSGTINISPPSDVLLGNLGLAQLHQQKIKAAIKSFLGALKINPDYYDALVNLASCYDHVNNLENAIVYANKAHNINPDNPVILNILARQSMASNNTKKSIILFTKSLKLQTNQPQIYTQLSNAYLLTKNYDLAENILIKGLKILTENLYLLNSLGVFYASRNRHQEAIKQFDKVLSKNNSNTVAIASKIRSLTALQMFDQAYKHIISAYNQHPENTDICTELINYYILNRKYKDAYNTSSSFLKTLNPQSLLPGNIALAHSIACQQTDRLDEAKITLENVIKNNYIERNLQESIYYSQGEILDAMHLYDEAFKSYKAANIVIKQTTDIDYYETILEDLVNTVDRSFLDKIGTSDNLSSTPIFIVGMPRSGTSLIEQIISCHPDAYGAGELTDLWKIGNTISGAMNMLNYTKNFSSLSKSKLNEFSNNYLETINKLSNGTIRVTDKLPHNFMHIGLIECLFPNAKIIHCRRHPLDTCLSIYFKRFNDNHVYAKNLKEIARFYKRYVTLMDHWLKVSRLPILTVEYEKMVRNQKHETLNIIKHIDLDWTDKVLMHHDSNRIIMTPSQHQASKPIYTDSVYRWKNYRNHIQPLINVLGDPETYTQ